MGGFFDFKSAEERASEKAFGEGREEGRSEQVSPSMLGLYEVFGTAVPSTKEHESRLAGIRAGIDERSSGERQSDSSAAGFRSSNESEYYGSGTSVPEESSFRGVKIFFVLIFLGVGILLGGPVFDSLRTPSPSGLDDVGQLNSTPPNSTQVIVREGMQNRDLKTQLLNASYPSGCVNVFSDGEFGSMISLQDGDWDNEEADPTKHAYFGIYNNGIVFANLTGDGRREAVVHTACGLEVSTWAYSEVFIIDTSSRKLNVLCRLSPDDWGDNALGSTWNTSDVKVKSGIVAVSFLLGGSRAQPDWDATTAFTWDGNRFTRIGFAAHGLPNGSHPHDVIQSGIDLSAL